MTWQFFKMSCFSSPWKGWFFFCKFVFQFVFRSSSNQFCFSSIQVTVLKSFPNIMIFALPTTLEQTLACVTCHMIPFCHLNMFVIRKVTDERRSILTWSWSGFGVGRVSSPEFWFSGFGVWGLWGRRTLLFWESPWILSQFYPIFKAHRMKTQTTQDFYLPCFILVQSSVCRIPWFKVLSCVLLSEFLVALRGKTYEWEQFAVTPVLCGGTWGCRVGWVCFLGRVEGNLLDFWGRLI